MSHTQDNKKDNTGRKLTAKEELFCREYCVDFNATRAALKAGYSKKSAYSIGSENLKKPEIQKQISYYQSHLAELSGISALKIIDEHAKIAFSNAGQLRTGWMTMKEFENLSDEDKACIQEVQTKETKRKTNDGDDLVDTWVKVKLYDKQKSLDSLTNILGFNAPVKTESSMNLSLFEPLSREDRDRIKRELEKDY